MDRSGTRHAQLRAPRDLSALDCSDEGASFVVGGKEGDLWWLAPDLMPRWQRTLGKRVDAVAVDPLGQRVAAADAGGNVSLFTRKGRPLWQVQSPRPLRFLAFVPEAPFLIGSADFGLVALFDARGHMVWRDGLVAHVGSLGTSGDGSVIVLACFTDGLNRYSIKNARPKRQPLPEACRLAALSYDGQTTLTAGLTSTIALLDRKARVVGDHKMDAPATVLAMSALADRCVLGTAVGLVQCLRWQ
jgi:hypothetical protein